jgi:hypothetical protein
MITIKNKKILSFLFLAIYGEWLSDAKLGTFEVTVPRVQCIKLRHLKL